MPWAEKLFNKVCNSIPDKAQLAREIQEEKNVFDYFCAQERDVDEAHKAHNHVVTHKNPCPPVAMLQSPEGKANHDGHLGCRRNLSQSWERLKDEPEEENDDEDNEQMVKPTNAVAV